MGRPDLSRVPVFYHNYINQVPEDELMPAFKNGTAAFIRLLENLPPGKLDHQYAEGKWTIREVIQHIIDAERVFGYRALRFARKDPTPLPGFDENLFAQTAKADKRNWDDLVNEFKAVRLSSEYLFGSFDNEQLEASGISNNNAVYVLAWGYITIGHCLHHKSIIEERYL